MLKRKGQSILEYTVVMVIILGVFIGMKDYIKRGFSGKWKDATDNLGDQYDPQNVNSSILYETQVNSASIIAVENAVVDFTQGQWTNRVDSSNSLETKSGYTQVNENN